MANQNLDLDKFYETLKQEQLARQKQLLENPEEEQNRLNLLKFKHIIETLWQPVIEEYLTVLGKLWFGEEMRLRGPEFRKELVACPAYMVAHEVYGPMAVFWVANNWNEREAPYSENETRTELYRMGYRCCVVINEDNQYNFQGDDHKTIVQFENGDQINREKLMNVFAEVYLIGPVTIYNHWKDFGIVSGK